MFENRINTFPPNLGAPPFSLGVSPAARASEQQRSAMSVQIAEIYQAAVNRAIEEHELDKLFNPDFFNYEI